MSDLKPNEYKCDICKNVYNKTLTDEEAFEAYKEGPFKGPDSLTKEDMGIVCDDCFKELSNLHGVGEN